MARTRTGAELIDDAYLRADLVGATARHPRTSVLRYVNQGGARLYGLLIDARGRAYYAKKPAQTITTAAATSRYALASDFLRLSAVRCAGPGGFMLEPFTAQDEPMLREPGVSTAKPTHYELQPGYLELLPLHSANLSIIVDYVPTFTDLTDGSVTFDGINGWEEYASTYAASRMLDRDDEAGQAASCERFMSGLALEISKLAPQRDAFRAERVKNVRGGWYPYGGRFG